MKIKHMWAEPLLWWAYGALIITSAAALLYVVVQQNFRDSANDPQIQMARDTAHVLEQGAALLDLVPPGSVEIGESLKPFLVLYDTEGNPIVGNGFIENNDLLLVPKGVFESAKAAGENRVTLEPKKGVRIAAIVVPFVGREANGYALAGRSLQEIELREGKLNHILFIGWAATLLGLLAAVYIGRFILK